MKVPPSLRQTQKLADDEALREFRKRGEHENDFHRLPFPRVRYRSLIEESMNRLCVKDFRPSRKGYSENFDTTELVAALSNK